MNLKLWQSAKESFEKHGGLLHREVPPETLAESRSTDIDTSKVVFSHERQDNETMGTGAVCIYRHYKAPNKATALEWLKDQSVSEQLVYLVVETPEGNISKDCMGIF